MSAEPTGTPAADLAGAAGALAAEAAARAVAAGFLDPEGRLRVDPERVERDLARLVLALMEALRRLLELQAIGRMERGTLSEEEEERLGLALARARAKLREIAGLFGLGEADLLLDLGPLGRLG